MPLPRSVQADAQHQVALVIREGRKAARELTAAAGMSNSSKEASSTTPGTNNLTSQSTVLEQDFTVEGQKGQLNCPFSPRQTAVENGEDGAGTADVGVDDPTPHHSADPICAAMYEENVHAPAPAAASNAQCPIRFMDKHSPEEIAHYIETHKHEIPRSHEVCVRRYQRNEEQIRKLDAKYGNLVNMIQDLSHLHKPLMPEGEREPDVQDRASTKRVENWANGVSSADEAGEPDVPEEERRLADDRESHFDRPLKEVRVGESPSRPWGISVPVLNSPEQHHAHAAESPPPAPVQHYGSVRNTLSTVPSPAPEPQRRPAGKCPFDHTKFDMGGMAQMFGNMAVPGTPVPAEAERPHTPAEDQARDLNTSPPPLRPTFVSSPPQPETVPGPGDGKPSDQPPPRMVFNISGPVFIGYPMEQAMQLMQAWQGGSH